mmetsp:Transcript_4648/g.13420  ORF Transcript_4648/g.13420 Transcript_4648/m.13420 type:complete len:212 (-) Transcript_4648:75-710(-)
MAKRRTKKIVAGRGEHRIITCKGCAGVERIHTCRCCCRERLLVVVVVEQPIVRSGTQKVDGCIQDSGRGRRRSKHRLQVVLVVVDIVVVSAAGCVLVMTTAVVVVVAAVAAGRGIREGGVAFLQGRDDVERHQVVGCDRVLEHVRKLMRTVALVADVAVPRGDGERHVDLLCCSLLLLLRATGLCKIVVMSARGGGRETRRRGNGFLDGRF